MQISDLIGQYNNSLNAGSRIANGTRGMNQVSDTMNKLGTGQLFEGTVTGTKAGQVTLTLGNGQAINARLAGDVNLIEGESVFFEVKSNDGNTINIRPVSMGTMNNPTLLTALDSANLPVTEDSLNMVKTMMSEQMPIDAGSLANMAKLKNLYPDTDIATLVTMKKLDMEVSPEMIEQFEHYQANEGAILDSVASLADAFVEAIANPEVSAEDIKAFQDNLMQVIDPEAVSDVPEDAPADEAAAEGTGEADGGLLKEVTGEKGESVPAQTAKDVGAAVNAESAESVSAPAAASVKADKATESAGYTGEAKAAAEGAGAEKTAAAAPFSDAAVTGTADGAVEEIKTHITILSAEDDPEISQLVKDAGEESADAFPNNSLGAALSKEEIDDLTQSLKDAGLLQKLTEFTEKNQKLSPQTDATKLLTAINEQMKSSPELSKEDMRKVLSLDGYKAALKSALQKKWTIAPEEVADRENIKTLYEDIEKDVARIAQSAADMTKGDNPLSQSAKQVHNNIDFMNQVNQTYNYIQLPLKLAGQQATGDLYVYSNKKRSIGENDEVSAFLHFDLEHLGATDISVKMRNKKVDTKFYMEDDAAFDLIEKNLPVLQAKLEKLGYNVALSVEGGGETVDFVEDFLKQDAASVGTITRYSFDMRA